MTNDGIDYKKKYEDLKARFIESLDNAFRTGYEQGFNESQVQAQAQQAQMMQQQMAMQQQAMNQAPGGMEGQSVPQEAQQGQGSEMDGMIAELEGLVNKNEPNVADLKKSIEKMKNQIMFSNLSKKTAEIALKKSMSNKIFAPSKSFTINLSENSKQAISAQSKIVDNILNKWENEAQNSARDITQILGTEALTKKE